MATKVRVGDYGDFEFVQITPEAIAEALLAHPKISRVWFNDQTGEFAALTDAGMSFFRVGFPGAAKNLS